MLYGVFGGSTSDINVAKEGSFHRLVVPCGIPVTVAGKMDVNQDGIADIAIGCPGDIYGRYLYVIYGKRQSSTWHAMDVTAMGRVRVWQWNLRAGNIWKSVGNIEIYGSEPHF